jgi:hypothetical protein
MTLPIRTEEEWRRLMTPLPYVAEGRALTEAETAEVANLTVSICHGVKGAHRQLEEYGLCGIRFIDLLALRLDPDATWQAWSDHVAGALAAIRSARKAHARLVQLLGPAATVRDHAFEAGTEQMSLKAIEEHVAGAEELAAPYIALAKTLKGPARRAA